MPNNLLDALFMDLKEQNFSEQEKSKIYLRWLVGEVYMKKQKNDTNTHRYISYKKEKNEDIIEELKSLSYHSERYLNYEDFINVITDTIFSMYLSQNKNNNDIYSFDDVMVKTLNYYETKFDKYNKNSVVNFARVILNDYIVKKNVRVFSSKNNTREYVIKSGEEKIIEEMKSKVGICDSINTLINNYSVILANYYMSLNNDMDNLKDEISNQILNLNLNDRQKDYLLKEFEIGNVSALNGYIDEGLIEKYKASLDSNKTKTI